MGSSSARLGTYATFRIFHHFRDTTWELEEVFWLAKHGAKMTGMPAFGLTHDDQTLWNVAAFVKQLPAMTPEEYAATGDSGQKDSAEDGGGH